MRGFLSSKFEMDLSPNSQQQRSSVVLKGIGGGLTQWDDLKSWHIRQEALLIQSSPSKNQANCKENGLSSGPDVPNRQISTFGANLMSLLIQTKNFSLEDRTKNNHYEDVGNSPSNERPTTNINAHHDLSMIPELDEDTRTTVDVVTSDDEKTPTASRNKVENVPKLPLSIPTLKIVPSNPVKSDMPSAPLNSKPAGNSQFQPDSKATEIKRRTKPFLRRGQGLVRFNLRPDDVLKPYQNGKKNSSRSTKPPPKPRAAKPSTCLKQPVDCPFALSSLQLKKDPPKNSEQNIATQRVNPSNFANPPTSTKLSSFENRASVANSGGFATWSHLLAQDPDEENLEEEKRNTVSGLTGVHRMQEAVHRHNFIGSPKRTGTLRSGGRVQEEDEESLAAYIALEKHVGDTSFCSTSSKVDHLVAKSSRSNSSYSPRRQYRTVPAETKERKVSSGRENEREEPPGKPEPETNANPAQLNDDNSLSDWAAEEEELRRRKMSQFTTGGIKVTQNTEDESLSESESDVESDSQEEDDTMFSSIPLNPVKAADLAPINNPCDTSTASIDFVIENINRKVEEHLSRLCVEIETLQKSNTTAKNQVKSLKKQLRKLEQKLATEHLAYERKLAEQRDDFSNALADEKAKTAKEKANFERFCREQKKKEPSSVVLDQLERLKSDMVAKEEKWRAERARTRGVECNLRIQITNLRQENEKLKAENSKLKREMETAANAAKAKNVSNTKVINAIAQQLSKAKPQVTVTKLSKAPSGKVAASQEDPTNKVAASTIAKQAQVPTIKQPTIGVFPTAKPVSCEDDGWSSSDEEIDLGPKTPEKLEEELSKAVSKGNVKGIEDCIQSAGDSLTESVIAETEARYKAFFEDKDSPAYNVPTNRTEPSSANNLIVYPDGSIERKKSNGTSVLTLPDGTQKRQDKNGSVITVPPSGWPISVSYFNGDKHERHEDGSDHYFYAKTQTWQITHPDGRKELRLPNGVVSDEKANGPRTVTIPMETAKADKCAVPDRQDSNEARRVPETIVILPNGDQEIRTKDYVERRFQDGTVRFLYKDGIQKTIYTSGRVRVKDKTGKLLMDTAVTGIL